MELSCKSEYALLALLALAANAASGEPLQIRQIAAEQHIPDRYLEQLLATLRRGGLVRSQRGAKGGYVLAQEPWQVTLFDVVSCIEGVEGQSAEGAREARSLEGSVILDVWQEACQAADTVLQKYTLQDLLEKRDARRQLDIMYYI
ncbi:MULTISPECIES: Rrf2 family transcriptional regulator [unclassified Leptolyngbya]|uniref:Rrf2 family transcriptional regulator n=1 Tax=unclassified Leptolyngbya TaxID=2650499 RepID=UPI001689EB10|nr:Rrf2 family transcriptional regulator [Leptolyngbya sp. FACHB-8]MBD2153929.1 Rrf2 family transcriptional regulator [Leptolyngbya sp. FACHB-16]